MHGTALNVGYDMFIIKVRMAGVLVLVSEKRKMALVACNA